MYNWESRPYLYRHSNHLEDHLHRCCADGTGVFFIKSIISIFQGINLLHVQPGLFLKVDELI